MCQQPTSPLTQITTNVTARYLSRVNGDYASRGALAAPLVLPRPAEPDSIGGQALSSSSFQSESDGCSGQQLLDLEETFQQSARAIHVRAFESHHTCFKSYGEL